eukprot:6205779-Pleurochrysis_carterae.AAC.1
MFACERACVRVRACVRECCSRLPCRLDAERLLNLHDVSRPRERTANTRSAHHRKQPRAFDQQPAHAQRARTHARDRASMQTRTQAR